MKQIEDLTNSDIDMIVSIMLNKQKQNLIIQRTDDKKFVIAEYKRERDIVNDGKYDYVKMYITIDENFQIKNKWGYVNETPAKGCLGEAVSTQDLYRYQYITRWLLQKGYDIYQEEIEKESN